MTHSAISLSRHTFLLNYQRPIKCILSTFYGKQQGGARTARSAGWVHDRPFIAENRLDPFLSLTACPQQQLRERARWDSVDL